MVPQHRLHEPRPHTQPRPRRAGHFGRSTPDRYRQSRTWSTLESLAGYLLIAALLVAPWLFGSNPDWARFTLTIPLGISSLLCIALVASGRRLGHVSALVGCGLAMIGLGLLQLVAPATSPLARLQHALLAQDLAPSGELTDRTASGIEYVWTCCPEATWTALPLYAIATAVFVIASLLSQRRDFINSLLFAVALNGFVLAAFGMYQKVRWDNIPFGSIVGEYGGQPYASYFNRNNAAAYLQLCFAAAVTLLLRVQEARRRGPATSWRTDRREELTWFALAAMGGIAAGVVATLSRSGILSLIFGILVTLPFVLKSRQHVKVALAGLAIWFVVVVSAGWFGDLTERFLMIDETTLQQGRMDHWHHTIPALSDFLWTGSGLGTYSSANRAYQTTALWFTRADNQYLEVALECGIWGLGLIALLFYGLFRHASSLVTAMKQTYARQSILVLLLFICASQTVHSVFDFGIVIPANLLTAAALLGISTSKSLSYAQANRAALKQPDSLGRLSRFVPAHPRRALLLVITACGLLTTSFIILRPASDIELLARRVRDLERSRPTNDELAARSVLESELSPYDQPPSPTVLDSRAKLVERQFRTRLASTLVPAGTSPSPAQWRNTELTQLTLATSGLPDLTAELRQHIRAHGLLPLLLEAEDLRLQVIELAPLSSPSWKSLTNLRFLRNAPADDLLKAANMSTLLRPFDEDAVLIESMCLSQTGNHQSAINRYHYLLTLPSVSRDKVWNSARRFYSARFIVSELASDNPALQLQLFESIESPEDQSEFADWIIGQAANNLGSEARIEALPPEGNYLWGLAAMRTGDSKCARMHLHKAVDSRPWQVNWRITLATLLIEQGDSEAACTHLEHANRISPDNREVKTLFQQALQLPPRVPAVKR